MFLLSIQHHFARISLPPPLSNRLAQKKEEEEASNSSNGGSCVLQAEEPLAWNTKFSDSAQIPSTEKDAGHHLPAELKFQLNSMDDAAEYIEAILQRLHADVVVTSTAVIGDQRKTNDRRGRPCRSC